MPFGNWPRLIRSSAKVEVGNERGTRSTAAHFSLQWQRHSRRSIARSTSPDLIGFVDDSAEKQGTRVHGYPVFGREALSRYPTAQLLAVPGSPSILQVSPSGHRRFGHPRRALRHCRAPTGEGVAAGANWAKRIDHGGCRHHQQRCNWGPRLHPPEHGHPPRCGCRPLDPYRFRCKRGWRCRDRGELLRRQRLHHHSRRYGWETGHSLA